MFFYVFCFKLIVCVNIIYVDVSCIIDLLLDVIYLCRKIFLMLNKVIFLLIDKRKCIR